MGLKLRPSITVLWFKMDYKGKWCQFLIFKASSDCKSL
jgi:hypothetical protein